MFDCTEETRQNKGSTENKSLTEPGKYNSSENFSCTRKAKWDVWRQDGRTREVRLLHMLYNCSHGLGYRAIRRTFLRTWTATKRNNTLIGKLPLIINQRSLLTSRAISLRRSFEIDDDSKLHVWMSSILHMKDEDRKHCTLSIHLTSSYDTQEYLIYTPDCKIYNPASHARKPSFKFLRLYIDLHYTNMYKILTA